MRIRNYRCINLYLFKNLIKATPLGSLPFLEFEGKRLPQSMSIARYLAREFSLAGKNSEEQCKADAIVDTVAEVFEPLLKVAMARDPKVKVKIKFIFAAII